VEILIKPAKSQHQIEIIKIIEQENLDKVNVNYSEFIIALKQQSIIGIGRIRQHAENKELCSLGIVPEERGKGIGRSIVKALIEKVNGENLYLVSDIPLYFNKLGFVITEERPVQMLDKLEQCLKFLDCKAPVIMKYMP
jgi:N-acetylglutamate synthase-like GNAT family acetyltransferase